MTEKQARGPLGDARPDSSDAVRRPRKGKSKEKVEDRPTVGTVTPEDHPSQQ